MALVTASVVFDDEVMVGPGMQSVDAERAAWPERIVVGIDDSAQSHAALGRALQLAARAGATVIPVHAVGLLEEGRYRAGPDLPALVRAALATSACRPELVAPPIAEDGAAADVLLHVTERLGGDLLVVGRRGLGGAHTLGSTSEAVLRRASVPVLVVAAPAAPPHSP